MPQKLFFRTTRSAAEQLTELFDFVWTTSTALWNLRWQVAGLSSTQQSISDELLVGRFVAGSNIRGANLRHACIDTTWEQQQSQFAKFLLVDLIALYEGWLSKMIADLGLSQEEKAFQYPTSTYKGKVTGISAALSTLKAKPSLMTQDAFYPVLIKNPKNALSKIEELLICFRCFKEFRNNLIHEGGIASEKVFDAYAAYSTLTTHSLGVKEIPICLPVVTGQPISLSLRGVVGFSDIILRLLITLDAEFSCNIGAEAEFVSQWKQRFQTYKPGVKMNPAARIKHLRRLAGSIGMPKPAATAKLDSFLKKELLIV